MQLTKEKDEIQTQFDEQRELRLTAPEGRLEEIRRVSDKRHKRESTEQLPIGKGMGRI